MSEADLPPLWAESTLGEIADVQGGIQKGKKRSSSLGLRDVPYLRVANVQRGYLDLSEVQAIQATEAEISQLRLKVGDVLFNEGGDRDKLGRGWIWSGAISECIHQNHVFRARIIDRILDSKLLSWYGNTVGQLYFFDEGKQTTNLASLNSSKLKALPVLVPPQGEQTRMVEAIESYLTRLDNAMVTLERVQRNLKRYRASVLKAAVEGRLVPTEADLARAEGREYEPASVLLERILDERRRRWEEAELAKMKAKGKVPKNDKWKASYVEPVGPDTSELPELPEGWCWAGPEQIAAHEKHALGIGPFGSNLKVTDYREEGVPLIFVRNIRAESFLEDGAHYVSAEKAIELKPHIARAGDLLITKMGEPPGDAAIYPFGRPDGVITADCIRLRAHPILMSTPYLLSAIRSPIFQGQIVSITKGVAQKKVSLERFKLIAIPIAPLSEQYRIASEIDRLLSVRDAALNTVLRQAERVIRLRQSILKWAFEGRLVDQDPTDEPADVLLERIRAERAAGNGKKQPRTPRVNSRTASA